MQFLPALCFSDSASSRSGTGIVIALAVTFLAVTALALFDLRRHPKRLCLGEKKWPWALVIVGLPGLGWAVYLLFARLREEDLESDDE